MRAVPVGTSADTPHSLRMKAAEFSRLAEEARDADIANELRRLAVRYTERAAELGRRSAARPTVEGE